MPNSPYSFALSIRSLSLVASLLLVPSGLAGDDWPQFRGPQASGVSTASPAATSWNIETGENTLWQTPIPGLAHSAPIIWGERIYVTTAIGATDAELKVGLYGDIGSADDIGSHEWRLLSLDKRTGEIVYDVLGHTSVPKSKRHTKATHCNSTPATDGTHIVAIFGSEGLFCFDMDGTLQWQKDLGAMNSGYFKMPTAQWGFASSPVIHEGKVVVLCDVLEDSYIATFDLRDGSEVWRTPREDVPTWSTPTIVEVDGKPQILVNGWHHTGAYDFATGEEIWKLDGGGDIPVPTPIVANGLAYFTSAHGVVRPMRGIDLHASGDITAPEIDGTNDAIKWAHKRMGNYMQTPIAVGPYLLGCNDRGNLSCFDALSGEVHFSERLPGEGGGFTASPVSDGNHIFITAEMGKVLVIPVSDEFSILSTNELGDNCLATPALSEGVLFFRAQHSLIAISD